MVYYFINSGKIKRAGGRQNIARTQNVYASIPLHKFKIKKKLVDWYKRKCRTCIKRIYGCNTLFFTQDNVGIWWCIADKGFVSAVYFVAREEGLCQSQRMTNTFGNLSALNSKPPPVEYYFRFRFSVVLVRSSSRVKLAIWCQNWPLPALALVNVWPCQIFRLGGGFASLCCCNTTKGDGWAGKPIKPFSLAFLSSH